MGKSPGTRSFSSICIDHKVQICAFVVEGVTLTKIHAWMLEQGKKTPKQTIHEFTRGDWAIAKIAEIRKRFEDQTAEAFLSQKQHRVTALSDEAAKMRDRLSEYTYKDVDGAEYKGILREFRKTLLQMQGEMDKQKIEIEHVATSPFEKFMEQTRKMSGDSKSEVEGESLKEH